jgi:NOL1/NOP2/fmu family ribosome biogenesis protein
MTSNVGKRFDRLPETTRDRDVAGRATRQEVLEYFRNRFGIPPKTFAEYTFCEKGAGKIWALAFDMAGPLEIEALGMPVLRTRQEFWKPTTDAVQRFGGRADKNVIELDDREARTFLAGETQTVEWDGDWGYLIASRPMAGRTEPLGVGLFTYGELQSMVPKGRRREF